MINQRFLWPILIILIVAGFLGAREAALGAILLSSIALIFTPDQLKVRAYRVFDRVNERQFEEWLDERPEMAQALQYVQNLSPDDFITFSRLIVEVRYKKDQAALEIISRHFRKEKGQ